MPPTTPPQFRSMVRSSQNATAMSACTMARRPDCGNWHTCSTDLARRPPGSPFVPTGQWNEGSLVAHRQARAALNLEPRTSRRGHRPSASSRLPSLPTSSTRSSGLVDLKRSLANLAKHNISQLIALVKTRLKRMQYRPGLLDGFLAHRARPHTLL